MNAETLLDALSQLPDDMIAQTDALRQRKPAPVLWKRLVPIAACLALVIGVLTVAMPLLQRNKVSMDSMESIQQAAPMAPESAGEPESPAEAAPEAVGGAPLAPEAEETAGCSNQSIPVTAGTFFYTGGEPEGITTEIISSPAQLQNSRLMTEDIPVDSYDEAWFRENQLILLLTDAASSSVRYHIHTIHRTAPGCWELDGIRMEPEWQTEDMTRQLILVELPRMVEPEDTVLLNLAIIEE